ncbi:hypothetical protein GLYMA_11G198700v4 [Glycine max]|uniref:Uncharacterized protein n=1 Tax=Glycine max TaxID=3847 RepID=A0A0R0HJH7_SOYBN|nr:hypothetical protein GYH30_031649 [Glycine max]KRH30657.1 hypothetical protein GLYMA_11G198700v4 [Glycine max]
MFLLTIFFMINMFLLTIFFMFPMFDKCLLSVAMREFHMRANNGNLVCNMFEISMLLCLGVGFFFLNASPSYYLSFP